MAGPDYTLEEILAQQGVAYLLSGEDKVPFPSGEEKSICLLFSANWCRPCKTFIPLLVQVYNTLKSTRKDLEIIFISFDRDEDGFKQHFNCMPWLAVPFDDNVKKKLSSFYHVDHIPSFIPLGVGGKFVEKDAVGLIEDYGVDAFPFTKKRQEELKAQDEAKRQRGNLDELFAYGGKHSLVYCKGGEVWASQLVGKTIGLYFGANWSPPCHNFTTQLTEAYNEIITNNQGFEIVFVSTDKNHIEFDLSVSKMPWLAIPYEDRTRQDLCRIFEIKGIPALILLGPDGRIISADGRTLISLYGATGFPFTESRIAEIEALLKKEGDLLPDQVGDSKHEHVLKLDMAKAYICDFCKKHGRFWAFSCNVCDYDLHPACTEVSI